MKVFFVHSGMYEYILKEEDCKLLVNYVYMNKQYPRHPDIPYGFKEVIIDSGGFQALTGTGEAYINGYTLWLQLMLPKHPEVLGYFNLDQKLLKDTINNQLYMESEGLEPIPVWHTWDGTDTLDDYCSTHEWISIGGIVSSGAISKKDIFSLLAWLILRYPNNRFHILGVGLSGSTAFKQFRPYSVDFSTWSTVSRFGHEIVYDKKTLAKEVSMSDSDRERLRKDKVFAESIVRRSVKVLKNFEQQVNDLVITETQSGFKFN